MILDLLLEVAILTQKAHLNRRNTIPKQTPTNNVKMFKEDWPSTRIILKNGRISEESVYFLHLQKSLCLSKVHLGLVRRTLDCKLLKHYLHNSNQWLQEVSDCQEDEDLQENNQGHASLLKPYMLVVCYTNHALDQFVEGIVDFLPENLFDGRFPRVVRFGRQCKNPKLEQLSIQNVRRKVRWDF
ncbi:unnamed protein product [Mytilus edulis]|uniref:Uncharacterized protein n=1 Tax=Mytilus edulis TaxID=6550 RepID=A0A8S3QP22_MYTED|nr:unnamed protein product [Mytilus edulis]